MKNITAFLFFIFTVLAQNAWAQTNLANEPLKKDTLAKHLLERSEIFVRGILNIPLPEMGIRYHFTPRLRGLASYTYHNLNSEISFLGQQVTTQNRYHIAKIGGEYTFSRKPLHGFVHLDAYYAGGAFYERTGTDAPGTKYFDIKSGTQNGGGLGVGLGLEYEIKNRVFINIMPYISFLSTATRSYQHNALETGSSVNIQTKIDEYVVNERGSFFFFYPVTLSVGCRL